MNARACDVLLVADAGVWVSITGGSVDDRNRAGQNTT
jgi:hypothetical protein